MNKSFKAVVHKIICCVQHWFLVVNALENLRIAARVSRALPPTSFTDHFTYHDDEEAGKEDHHEEDHHLRVDGFFVSGAKASQLILRRPLTPPQHSCFQIAEVWLCFIIVVFIVSLFIDAH